jgi:hypothetical protein
MDRHRLSKIQQMLSSFMGNHEASRVREEEAVALEKQEVLADEVDEAEELLKEEIKKKLLEDQIAELRLAQGEVSVNTVRR